MEENKDKYFSTVQVSRELNIELPVLKKISYLIEKAVQKKDFFHRNNKNQRLYNTDQIDDIEDILETKRDKKVSYSVAVYMIFNDKNNEISEANSNDKGLYQWFENMEMYMSMQEQKIEKLTISLEALTNLESQNYKSIQLMNERINEHLNCKQKSRVQKNKEGFKKKLAIGNAETSKKVLIRKKDLRKLQNKIVYLPSIWKAKKNKLEMTSSDQQYYTGYVKNAANAYEQLLKERRKLGRYYILPSELKEIIDWYGQFYDYLNEV